MGMCDTITAVGHPVVPDGNYQTKSLECGLDRYELRADGSLWLVQRFDDDGPSQRPTRIKRTGAVHFSGKGGSFVAMYMDGVIVHLGRKP